MLPPPRDFSGPVFFKGYWVPKSTQVVRPLDPVAFLAQGQKKYAKYKKMLKNHQKMGPMCDTIFKGFLGSRNQMKGFIW